MTSSSSLFLNRRIRVGRNGEGLGDGLELHSSSTTSSSSVDRSNRRHRGNNNHLRRDRHNPEGRNLTAPHHSSAYRASRPPEDRVTTESDHQSSLSFNLPERSAFSANGRLPRAVILARERLLQRLSGLALTDSRQSNNGSGSSSQSGIPIGDDIELSPAETDTSWQSKRSEGLTPEALNSLPIEFFNPSDEGNEPDIFKDCSICLESFSIGDELVRLRCGHGYHICCLYPWLQTCGDCPYCRQRINVSM